MERRIRGVLSPKSSGSITITENGNYDVVDVANVIVNVKTSGTAGEPVIVKTELVKGYPIEGGKIISKIFPNLNASSKDIETAIINYINAADSYAKQIWYGIFKPDYSEGYALMGIVQDGLIMVVWMNMITEAPAMFLYVSQEFPDFGVTKAGWQTENLSEEGCFELPVDGFENLGYEASPSAYDYLTPIFSIDNDFPSANKKLSGIYDGSSINITSNGNIDISSMLDENKLPLKIKVDVNMEGVTTLKAVLDITKNCDSLFQNATSISDLTGLIQYNDTEYVTDMTRMCAGCSNLLTFPPLNTSCVGNIEYMFTDCIKLINAPVLNLQFCESTYQTFYNCESLQSITLENTYNLTAMNMTFCNCKKLKRIKLETPKVGAMISTFNGCTDLTIIDISYWGITISSNVTNLIKNCTSLKAFVIREFSDSYPICDTSSFQNSAISSGTGYFYVPRNMVDTLKATEYWSTYATQIRPLEDYTIDGTTTGELDESKI